MSICPLCDGDGMRGILGGTDPRACKVCWGYGDDDIQPPTDMERMVAYNRAVRLIKYHSRESFDRRDVQVLRWLIEHELMPTTKRHEVERALERSVRNLDGEQVRAQLVPYVGATSVERLIVDLCRVHVALFAQSARPRTRIHGVVA